MRRLLLATALLMLASAATAQVYKWTDPQGTVHYSQMPPAQGVRYTKVKSSRAQAPAASERAPAMTAADEAALQDGPAPASTAPIADTPENRQAMCKTLQSSLDALQGSGPVVMQKDGKPQLLGAEQREKQLAQIQERYQQYCPH